MASFGDEIEKKKKNKRAGTHSIISQRYVEGEFIAVPILRNVHALVSAISLNIHRRKVKSLFYGH